MAQCTACGASLRDGVRFCTQCGAPFAAPPQPPPADAATIIPDAPIASVSESPASETVTIRADDAPHPTATTAEGSPSRRAGRGRAPRVAERSSAASWALVTGAAPFVVSVVGNLVAAQLGARLADGVGSLAGLLGVLTVVFVLNAALLTVCGITGGRGIRETANGVTKGRGLAIAGLTLGVLNLALWVSGLVISATTLLPLFA